MSSVKAASVTSSLVMSPTPTPSPHFLDCQGPVRLQRRKCIVPIAQKPERRAWMKIHKTWLSTERKTIAAQVMGTYRVDAHELVSFHWHQVSLHISGKILRSEKRPDLLKSQRSLEDLMRNTPIITLFSRNILGTCQVSGLEPRRAQEWRLRPSLCLEVFALWHWWWLGWWALGINVAFDHLSTYQLWFSEACGITQTSLALCGNQNTW